MTEIRGRHLKVIQSEMEAKGLALTTINHYCSRINRCFRWGVGEDLVPPDVAAILESVPNLQPGASSAAQTDPVRSVPEERVEATLPPPPPRSWPAEGLGRYDPRSSSSPDAGRASCAP